MSKPDQPQNPPPNDPNGTPHPNPPFPTKPITPPNGHPRDVSRQGTARQLTAVQAAAGQCQARRGRTRATHNDAAGHGIGSSGPGRTPLGAAWISWGGRQLSGFDAPTPTRGELPATKFGRWWRFREDLFRGYLERRTVRDPQERTEQAKAVRGSA